LQQVRGLAAAGATVLVYPGCIHQGVTHPAVIFHPTLSRGRVRLPYRLLGTRRTADLHDRIVAHNLRRLAGQVDVVHGWPLGSLRTFQTAATMGIPTVFERPNTHTRYAYEVVARESARMGIQLPPGSEHAFSAPDLARELDEYAQADRLLCPSDFVAKTFLDEGFDAAKLIRHQYGYDEQRYRPATGPRDPERGLTVLFAGFCAVRKGLHFALEAWLKSAAHHRGTFLVVGDFLPAYAEKLAPMLADPSVKILGHRDDMPELMRRSDILVLPSIEEGSALVTAEARGSGCVLLVSDAAGAMCRHMENALVHRAGDVAALTEHLTLLDDNRDLLERLRASSIASIQEITWSAAGVRLLQVYEEVIAGYRQGQAAMAHASAAGN
jgi:glycosyltransferase involved in cell wall biosynthesis